MVIISKKGILEFCLTVSLLKLTVKHCISCLWLTGCKQQWDQYSTQLETHRLSKVQLYIPRLWRYCLLCNSLINRISSCSSWYMYIYIYAIALPNYIFDNFWYNIMYDFIWFVILYKLLWKEVQGRLWSKPLLNFPGTSLIKNYIKMTASFRLLFFTWLFSAHRPTAGHVFLCLYNILA